MKQIHSRVEHLHERTAPNCPHCLGRTMGEAALTFAELLDFWPLAAFFTRDGAGYVTDAREGLTLHCPECGKPSAVRIDAHERAWLVPARSRADLDFIRERASGVKPK